jgi:glycosyltransferase involved in cell wall biosynthesis
VLLLLVMKILIVGPAYPYKGGIASFNERLAQQLISMEHEVDLLTFTLQYPKVFFPGKTQFSEAESPDLNIERGINAVNPISWWTAGSKYRRHGYDLVIGRFWLPLMGPSLGATLRRISRGTNTKTISIIDNIIPHEKRPGDKVFAQYFVNANDAFVTMSHTVKDDLQPFLKGQPVGYAPHPIYDNYGEILPRHEALAALDLDPSLQYVLFFGFIRKYKGLDLLMKAFAIASRTNDMLQLLVAGEYYSDEQQYQDLIDELDIRGKVVLHTDFIPNDRVKYYFCAADLVAQTYRSATQSGISQLAIHFERPILSTDVGGLPETTIDRQTGYLTPVDIEAIASALRLHFGMATPPDYQKGIQQIKEKFSWQRFAETIINLYRSL